MKRTHPVVLRLVALALLRWPHSSLIQLCHRRETFIHELLQASAFVGFGGVDVPFRIRSDAVHAIELTGLASTIGEARQDFKRVALDDVHLLVTTVGEIDILLLWVFRESNVPHRTIG